LHKILIFLGMCRTMVSAAASPNAFLKTRLARTSTDSVTISAHPGYPVGHVYALGKTQCRSLLLAAAKLKWNLSPPEGLTSYGYCNEFKPMTPLLFASRHVIVFVMKFPYRLVGRQQYRHYKRTSQLYDAFMAKLGALFDAEGAEPKLLRSTFMKQLAASAPHTLLDIGANTGLWTSFLAKSFPRARVHSVEADPNTAALLRVNVQNFDNVVVHQLAVDSKPGRIIFHSHENSLLSSVLSLRDSHGKTTQVVVDAVTVDTLVETKIGACPALIKVDTEGNDLQVLIGASQTLANHQLKGIIMEYGFDPVNSRQVVIQELLDYLAAYRFRLRELHLAGVYSDSIYGNALFTRYEL
jgi:FkbM family methyltransferase